MKALRNSGYLLLACLFALNVSFSQNNKASSSFSDTLLPGTPLLCPELTAKFYRLNGGKLFWTVKGEYYTQLRQQLKTQIDSCPYLGLESARYHTAEIQLLLATVENYDDSSKLAAADKIFTDAAIALCKDILQGRKSNNWVEYDEISKKYAAADDDALPVKLAGIQTVNEMAGLFSSLEPAAKEYLLLKTELKMQLDKKAAIPGKQLSVCLNLFRWVHHFKFDKFMVVNIPSASFKYYGADSVMLLMKVVVGKPSTKTPRFAAYCNQVILYPYWNVPASIALNELLPKVKRSPAVLATMNMQVVDGAGNVIAPSKLNWQRFSRSYFPYRFRQSTGCDNSLGVIKFNITDPYSVYLHDTNNKTAFLSGYRFYSHGCIRVEKPIELGNLLLGNRLDTAFLQSCYKEQQPVSIDLTTPVPVFVIYSPADADAAGKIKYYKDVYGLLK